MLQSISSIAAWPLSHSAHDNTEPTELAARACEDRDPGYVYLSVSRTMPGFVQIASSPEDPTGLSWSLQTFSGVTKFKNVCVVRTSDCRELEDRFRKAVSFEQIPHHSDLFKLPLRFARQILEEEAQGLPATFAPERQAKKLPTWAFVAFSAVSVLAGAGLMLQQAEHPVAHTPAVVQKVEVQPAAPTTSAVIASAKVEEATATEAQPIKPKFRISKM